MSPLSELLAILALQDARAGQPVSPALASGQYARGGRAGALGLLKRQPAAVPTRLVQGQGGGQDDNVPAALSPGEYVWDADTVSAIGDGSNEEGARRLDQLRERIRAKKRAAPASKIPPKTGRLENYMQGMK